MTIKENLKFIVGSKILSQSPVVAGKEYLWVVEDDGMLGWYVTDEKITRVKVVDDDTITVSTEWENAREKRSKAGLPSPTTTICKEKISGFRVPSSMPGTKRE